jgi:NAD+ kinase
VLFLKVVLIKLMKLAVYIGKESEEHNGRVSELFRILRDAGMELVELAFGEAPSADVDMLLSVGGDGTFLYSSKLVIDSGIPIVGVNVGRVGFLSENRPEDVAEALVKGEYTIEDRSMLKASVSPSADSTEMSDYALNEITVHRTGAAMLGVDVDLDGVKLPTYWADGLVVSTSSGSTAYSLSVGGPIVLPESKVLIIAPIAPHNLNIRPLVVPVSAVLTLKMHSRDGKFALTADNRTVEVCEDVELTIKVAQFSLRRVRLNKSNFITALTEKLHWGEDVRNIR